MPGSIYGRTRPLLDGGFSLLILMPTEKNSPDLIINAAVKCVIKINKTRTEMDRSCYADCRFISSASLNRYF